MVFPLVPVLVTAGLGGLGYALFKPETAPAQSGGNAPAPTPTPAPRNDLPPVKRPQDLPRAEEPAQPIPIPIPVPNVQPAPMPAPAPLPIPIPPSNWQPPVPAPMPAPVPLPIPIPVAPSKDTGLITAPSGINVRQSPSKSSKALTSIPAASRVKLLSYLPTPTTGAPKGWYQIVTPNGITGYGTAEFILPDDGSNPVPNPIPNILPNILPNVSPVPLPIPSITDIQGRIKGNPGANLRAAPNTSGAIVKGLFNGAIVTVLTTKLAPASPGAPQGWVNVKDSTGAQGWVSREYCEPVIPMSFGHDSLGSTRRGTRKQSSILA